MAPKAKVLVPLYIYPLSESTWQPLYETWVLPYPQKPEENLVPKSRLIFFTRSISRHPNVDFVVVVNPNSGPGDSPLPGKDYVREVPKLNAYPNVSTVGYVRIHYCQKPLSEVFAEIERYAGWTKDHEIPGLGVEGILLDETPNHYSEQRAQYLEAVRQGIKATLGLGGDKLVSSRLTSSPPHPWQRSIAPCSLLPPLADSPDLQVIHNPGTPPDYALADPGPEVIVTSEEPFERFQGDEVQKRLRDYHYGQPRTAFMISGVPQEQVAEFARELRNRGAYLFVTDLVDDFYESFGSSWANFVAALDSD